MKRQQEKNKIISERATCLSTALVSGESCARPCTFESPLCGNEIKAMEAASILSPPWIFYFTFFLSKFIKIGKNVIGASEEAGGKIYT